MSKVSEWLNSGEYSTDIQNALTSIIRKSENSLSESETATAFETELYYLIRSKLGIDLYFKKESRVDGVIHSFEGLSSRSSGRGRLDAVVNGIVIEYKHHLKLKKPADFVKAQEQVCDYLMALYKNNKEESSAILTDGIHIQYFSFLEGCVQYTQIRPISSNDIDLIIQAILNNNTRKFDPSNIVMDFAISAQSQSTSKDIAVSLFTKLNHKCTEKTSMLFSEWKSLMHLSVDDNGKSQDIEKRRRDMSAIFSCPISDPTLEYKALFSLQTTYAIIVKLIACKVVDDLNFNSKTSEYHDLMSLDTYAMQKFFVQMEDGYSYKNMNIRNFLEGDFFSWYADEKQWDDAFCQIMRRIIAEVDNYSAFSLNVKYSPIDIFKDLYMSIIPQSVRHSMGEYFTPEWLADSVISKSLSYIVEKDNWKAIDPCCGSGIFIISLIKKIVGDVSPCDMSQEEKQQLQSRILGRVYGIDINPLSVLSARVSYYLALQQLGQVRDVEIPVYLGDSAIIPTTIAVDGIDCYSYSIDNLKRANFDVVLPKSFVKKNDFGQIMNSMQAMVKTDNADVLANVIFNELSDSVRRSKKLKQYVINLANCLVYLHKNQWDGIWIRIVSNFMLIARLDAFDMIVGNPPWVKWEHLPSAYTNKIKEFCDIRHIFCNDGMYGGAQLNICALISNVTASSWLKNNGVISFLMPDSIMSQNSYEEYRNFYLDYNRGERLYLQSIDRWFAPLRPFKVGNKSVTQDFNTYFWGRNVVDYIAGVPVREIRKREGISDSEINKCQTWSSVEPHLMISSGTAKQLSSDSTAFTYSSEDYDYSLIIGESSYEYRTGVESTPFEVFKLIGVGASNKVGNYRFTNDVRKTARYKVSSIPGDGWDFETRYIYPMVGGPNITPFHFDCANGYHIVPYETNDTKSPVPLNDLYARSKALASYFADNKALLEQQSEKSKSMHRGDEFYALSKIGPYTFAPVIVAARDNSRFCASVIKKTLTPWNEMKQSLCVKHTIIISQDKQGRFITENEAHYINGILNSSIVVSYIHNTFKKNGFSLKKSHLMLPKYDSCNPLCMKIVSLSKKATKDAKIRDSICMELSKVYQDLCKSIKDKKA